MQQLYAQMQYNGMQQPQSFGHEQYANYHWAHGHNQPPNRPFYDNSQQQHPQQQKHTQENLQRSKGFKKQTQQVHTPATCAADKRQNERHATKSVTRVHKKDERGSSKGNTTAPRQKPIQKKQAQKHTQKNQQQSKNPKKQTQQRHAVDASTADKRQIQNHAAESVIRIHKEDARGTSKGNTIQKQQPQKQLRKHQQQSKKFKEQTQQRPRAAADAAATHKRQKQNHGAKTGTAVHKGGARGASKAKRNVSPHEPIRKQNKKGKKMRSRRDNKKREKKKANKEINKEMNHIKNIQNTNAFATLDFGSEEEEC